jgi:hypothetical protein
VRLVICERGKLKSGSVLGVVLLPPCWCCLNGIATETGIFDGLDMCRTATGVRKCRHCICRFCLELQGKAAKCLGSGCKDVRCTLVGEYVVVFFWAKLCTKPPGVCSRDKVIEYLGMLVVISESMIAGGSKAHTVVMDR